MAEIEIHFLDVDIDDCQKKIEAISGRRESDLLLEEWIFKRDEWAPVNGRLRVRNENDHVLVSYKETVRNTGDGNEEIEFTIPTVTAALQFVGKMGIPLVRHQQKKRIHYTLGDVYIDIDMWPRIPPLLEIEGSSRARVEEVARSLSFDVNKSVELDIFYIYKDVYGIDLDKERELVF